jgi:hypothetical protein
MNILEVYKKYNIMPNLQEHQLRVGAVASVIYKSLTQEKFVGARHRDLLTACLLHDMGNIIKFKLGDLHFFGEEGIDFWEPVKQEFIKKYGSNEHVATISIARELNVPPSVFSVLENIGFSKSPKNLEEKVLVNMVACYSDQRVGPYGVLSLKERIEDGRKRFLSRVTDSNFRDEGFGIKVKALEDIEKLIFTNSTLKPSNINDKTIFEEIEVLKSFEI